MIIKGHYQSKEESKEQDKTFVNHVFHEDLIFIICKECIDKGIEQTLFQRTQNNDQCMKACSKFLSGTSKLKL